MFRTTSLAFLLAVAAAVQPLTASAQEKSCPEISCRAVYSFRTCDKPRPGAKVLSGHVLGVSRECNDIVQVQIEDWEANKVPRVVEIDIGSCASFAGKVGDLAQVGLVDPSPDVRRYHLACRLF
jgi:hypothetical protein